MRIFVPETLKLCKDINNEKNEETASKGLQIWGKEKHYNNIRRMT